MSAKSGTQELHSVGGSHIFFTNLTPSIELSLFGIVPASSKRYYQETISIPRTFASCSSLRPHTPLDTGLKFCTPPPAARCDNLMLMKKYGILKIDCCIPVLADRNIKKQGEGVSVIRIGTRRCVKIRNNYMLLIDFRKFLTDRPSFIDYSYFVGSVAGAFRHSYCSAA